MKKNTFYVVALFVMLLLVLFVPLRERLKESRIAAAASPLLPSSVAQPVMADMNTILSEGDPLEIPYIKNSDVFQEYLKIEDYAGISDSVVSVMQCLKDSQADPEGYYNANTRLISNTFGFGDKDVYISLVSSLQAPPSYAAVSNILKKNGYFYVIYKLYDAAGEHLCDLEANHLFLHNRYVASEYRMK